MSLGDAPLPICAAHTVNFLAGDGVTRLFTDNLCSKWGLYLQKKTSLQSGGLICNMKPLSEVGGPKKILYVDL